MNKKQFSVVMAVYKNDKKEFLKEALDSLLRQRLLPSEIIIVIDGLVNNKIKELLENIRGTNLTKIKIIPLKENKGLANALNIGINNANYDIIARMDADDICFEDRFEKQIPYLLDNDIDILGGQIIEFGKTKEDIVAYKRLPLEHTSIVKFLKRRNPITHPTVVFKKNVFNLISGYDVNAFPEDYDFFVRASMKGFKFGNLSDDLLWFRLGEDQEGMIRRRWGRKYALREYKLYKKFYNIGFYSLVKFLEMIVTRIPLRLLPFPIFKYIFLNIVRKSK